MNARAPDLEATDERLREWAHFFRDHAFRNHCRSIEHRFQAASEDFGPNGWGDNEAAPQPRPARAYGLRRALQTHEAIQRLDLVYKWALTYGYCYPYLPKHIVLRCMRKYTGRPGRGERKGWQWFLDTLDIGRMRVHTSTYCVFPAFTV